MTGWLKCLFGLHSWKKSEDHAWGETIKTRQCSRCSKRQRWVPYWFHQSGQGGSWVNL